MIESITLVSKTGRGEITIAMDPGSEYWLESVDWGTVKGQHQSYTSINQIGENIISTGLITRPLTITGWVVDEADSPLQTKCNFLNNYISPTEDYLLRFGDYQIPFRPDDSIDWGKEHDKNNDVMRQFLITATCPFPLFSKVVDTVVPFDFSVKKFRFPTDFGQVEKLVFATTEKVYNQVITNPGGFSTGVTIMIRFTGTVVNPKVKDISSGDFIGVNQTFISGERLTISTSVGSKTMTRQKVDGTRESVIKYRDVETSWLQLQAGRNVWALECDNMDQREAMEVSISFTPLYLEVE